MNGECEVYRLNEPMKWAEFIAMPREHQITYIKKLREKFNVPDARIARMLRVSQSSFSLYVRNLGLGVGKRSSHTMWDKDGWYLFTQGVKLSEIGAQTDPDVAQVTHFDPIAEETTDLYYHADYYFDGKYANPEWETVAKIAFGGKEFAPYAADLSQIRGEDLDGDGKTDSGSKKEKVEAYIYGLDIPDVEKNLMFRMQYSSFREKNGEIVRYVNDRSDLSYDQKVTLLEGLGYTVDDEGYVLDKDEYIDW